jgi:DNA repair protein RecO (recombination protein O)
MNTTKMSFENIYRVSLTHEVKEELYKILSIFISQNYFKKPKSLETLYYLKGVNKNE